MSNPNELQAAIEGNKREGRRGSYGAYPEMGMSGLHPGPGMPSQISPMSLVTGPRFNGNGTSHGMPPSKNIISAIIISRKWVISARFQLLLVYQENFKPNFSQIIVFDSVAVCTTADKLMWDFGQLIIPFPSVLDRHCVIQIFLCAARNLLCCGCLDKTCVLNLFQSVAFFIACRSTFKDTYFLVVVVVVVTVGKKWLML